MILWKISKKKYFFCGYSYSFWKDLSREYLVVSKFWLDVPKFKEHVQITVITLIEVCDLLFTLLKVITILVAYFQKFMNTNYSYWQILVIRAIFYCADWCCSNITVPIISMLFKYNWSSFSSILEPINNNGDIVFSGLIFPVFNAFQ